MAIEEVVVCQQCGKMFDPNHKPCMCRTCEQVALTKPGSTRLQQADAINPTHYRTSPSGVETIVVTEHMNFCLGNAMKYIWRAGQKGDAVEDLKKAVWYVQREISRLGTQPTSPQPSDQMQWLSRSDQSP